MSLVRPTRESIRGAMSYRALVMCVAALSLLWARSAPPNLPHGPLNLAFHSLADHDHRPCFDHEDPQWVTAPCTPLAAPPLVVSSCSIHASATLIEFVTDGWHYNRPPPVS